VGIRRSGADGRVCWCLTSTSTQTKKRWCGTNGWKTVCLVQQRTARHTLATAAFARLTSKMQRREKKSLGISKLGCQEAGSAV